jgi:predicted RNase H-like HicB family nuclease
MKASRYSMTIQWSDRDRAFVVSIPEFGRGVKTHGDTYEEAVKKGREVIESLVALYRSEGRPLPKPQKFAATPAAALNVGRMLEGRK